MILDISEESTQKTETVNATLTGITGVKWTSDDTTIATVFPSEGNSTTVTGVKRGTTTVMVIIMQIIITTKVIQQQINYQQM